MITCTSCISRNSMSFTYVTGSRCGGAKLIHSGRNMKIILLCPTDFTTAKWMANERVGGWSQNGQHGWFDHSWGIYHKDYTAPEQMGSVPFVGAKLTGSVSWRRHTVVVVCNYIIIRRILILGVVVSPNYGRDIGCAGSRGEYVDSSENLLVV